MQTWHEELMGGNYYHMTVTQVQRDSKLRDKLDSEPIETPDWELFTDGSSHKGETSSGVKEGPKQ